MKKWILINTLINTLIFLATVKLYSQIPNNNFETWANYDSFEDPAGWATLNFASISGLPITVTKNIEENGNISMRVRTEEYTNASSEKDTLPGIAITGSILFPSPTIVSGFPITGRPNTFTGSFKSNIVPEDTAFVTLSLFKYNPTTNQRDSLGAAIFYVTNTVNSFTKFDVPIGYTASREIPDTAVISVISSGKFPKPGNSIFLDDLALSYPTNQAFEFQTEKSFHAYPNPGNTFVMLEKIPSNAHILHIIDYTGKEKEKYTISSNTITISTINYPSGLYYYKIFSDKDLLGTGKFEIIK